MNPRKALGTKVVIAVVVLSIIIGGTMGLAIVTSTPAATSTSSTTSLTSVSASTAMTITIPVQSASNLNFPTGLRLNLNLSANSNGTLSVAIEEFNSLDQVNNVSIAESWPLEAHGGLFQWVQTICDDLNFPAGYEILQGNYGQNNFTAGAPLWLVAQIYIPSCAVLLPPTSYVFLPLSDVVSNETISASGTWSGFWTGSTGSSPGSIQGGACPNLNSSYNCPLTLNPFPPGTYTVVAADEWGQVVMLHFDVKGQ